MPPQFAERRDPGEIEQSVDAFARVPNGGLIPIPSAAAVRHRDLILTLAASRKLPAVYWERLFVAAGGLISDGPDLVDQFRQAANYVDRLAAALPAVSRVAWAQPYPTRPVRIIVGVPVRLFRAEVEQFRFVCYRTKAVCLLSDQSAFSGRHRMGRLVYRPQSSSASRLTAGASAFCILSQSGERPERYAESLRFQTCQCRRRVANNN